VAVALALSACGGTDRFGNVPAKAAGSCELFAKAKTGNFDTTPLKYDQLPHDYVAGNEDGFLALTFIPNGSEKHVQEKIGAVVKDVHQNYYLAIPAAGNPLPRSKNFEDIISQSAPDAAVVVDVEADGTLRQYALTVDCVLDQLDGGSNILLPSQL
jgi:hypothetical protein